MGQIGSGLEFQFNFGSGSINWVTYVVGWIVQLWLAVSLT